MVAPMSYAPRNIYELILFGPPAWFKPPEKGVNVKPPPPPPPPLKRGTPEYKERERAYRANLHKNNPESLVGKRISQQSYKNRFIEKYGKEEWNLRHRLYKIKFKLNHDLPLSKSEIELRKENRKCRTL